MEVFGNAQVNGVAMHTSVSGFVLGQSYPNPATEEAQVIVTLPKQSLVHVELLDARGVVVRSVFNGALSLGDHTLATDTKELASGTYFYVLTSGDIRLIRSLVVAR
jgi:hypothetical protein